MSATILVYDQDADRYAGLIRLPPRRSAEVRRARNAEEAAPILGDVDVLYAWKFPPALYAKAGRLRWLQAMGAGVTVTRAPGIFGPWIAEYVVGWCASVTQRMSAYLEAQSQRRWLSGVLPDRLRGKTLTIVGLGDVGRAVARAARAFDMQ